MLEETIKRIIVELDAEFKESIKKTSWKGNQATGEFQKGYNTALEAACIIIDGYPGKTKEDLFNSIRRFDDTTAREERKDDVYDQFIAYIHEKVDKHPVLTFQDGIKAGHIAVMKLLRTPSYELKEITSAARRYWANPRQIDEEKKKEMEKDKGMGNGADEKKAS